MNGRTPISRKKSRPAKGAAERPAAEAVPLPIRPPTTGSAERDSRNRLRLHMALDLLPARAGRDAVRGQRAAMQSISTSELPGMPP